MTQNGRDRIEKTRREANEKSLVEGLFEQAVVRQLEADARDQVLEHAMCRQACEQDRQNPPLAVEGPKGVHYTKLQEKQHGEPLADEWNTYCREVGRLLAEGQEGRHVLIKGGEIIGIFDTSDAAYAAGHKQYPGVNFFVHPIRAEEPYLRIRGVNYPWPNSLSG